MKFIRIALIIFLIGCKKEIQPVQNTFDVNVKYKLIGTCEYFYMGVYTTNGKYYQSKLTWNEKERTFSNTIQLGANKNDSINIRAYFSGYENPVKNYGIITLIKDSVLIYEETFGSQTIINKWIKL